MKHENQTKKTNQIISHFNETFNSLEKLLRDKDEIILKLNMLIDVNHVIASSLDKKKVLKTILDQTLKLMNCMKASLLLVDQSTNQLHFEISSDDKDLQQLKDVRLNMGEGIAGSVWENGKPLLIEDARMDLRFSDKADTKSDFVTTSVMAVPLISSGQIIGVMEAINKADSSFFNKFDLDLFQNLSVQAAVAIDNANLYELAIYDGKTRLYIHRYFMQRFSDEFRRTERYGGKISVIMFDIDHFKKVNDTYGHQIGDDVLIHVAKEIKKHCRISDIPSRFGGEEFAVLLTETNSEGAFIFAEKIRKNVEEMIFASDDTKFRITISAGVVTFPETGAASDLELLNYADRALYESKETGRNKSTSYKKEK